MFCFFVLFIAEFLSCIATVSREFPIKKPVKLLLLFVDVDVPVDARLCHASMVKQKVCFQTAVQAATARAAHNF